MFSFGLKISYAGDFNQLSVAFPEVDQNEVKINKQETLLHYLCSHPISILFAILQNKTNAIFYNSTNAHNFSHINFSLARNFIYAQNAEVICELRKIKQSLNAKENLTQHFNKLIVIGREREVKNKNNEKF